MVFIEHVKDKEKNKLIKQMNRKILTSKNIFLYFVSVTVVHPLSSTDTTAA